MTTNALEIQSDSSTLATVDQVGVAQVNAQNGAAVQAVQAAIAAANPKANGVNFGAFNAKVFPTASSFTNIYDGGGNTSISFYRFQGTPPSGGWLPLGDIVGVPSGNLPPGVMFFAPGSDPDAFAHPTGFARILDDGGSGNPSDVVYWRPIPPAGYVAVGICFTNGDPPYVGAYWCVHEHYVQQVSYGPIEAWNDSGSHWSANGDLLVPTFTASTPEVAPEGSILILPPTFLSLQDADAELPYALVGRQATLDVATIARPAPVYVEGVTATGSTTASGLGKVVVVPFTAVPSDDGIPNQALSSPFYYVASMPSWLCTQVLPTPKGGTLTYTETNGVSQTDSTRFQQTTSMTVSCEFGAAYGGASAKVSASLTKELQLETSHSTTGATENTFQVELNLPVQPVTSVWEGQSSIQVFRADGAPLSTVAYSMADLRFAPSEMTPALLALQAALARG